MFAFSEIFSVLGGDFVVYLHARIESLKRFECPAPPRYLSHLLRKQWTFIRIVYYCNCRVYFEKSPPLRLLSENESAHIQVYQVAHVNEKRIRELKWKVTLLLLRHCTLDVFIFLLFSLLCFARHWFALRRFVPMFQCSNMRSSGSLWGINSENNGRHLFAFACSVFRSSALQWAIYITILTCARRDQQIEQSCDRVISAREELGAQLKWKSGIIILSVILYVLFFLRRVWYLYIYRFGQTKRWTQRLKYTWN